MTKGDIILPRFTREDMAESKLPIITVYNDRTIEYPGQFVARLFDVAVPTRKVVIKPTLEELRKCIPSHMMNLIREDLDAPEIIESYI